MNTISILQDEAHNMPEGLYLRLMDALKKDFDIKEEGGVSSEDQVKFMFWGYMDGIEDNDDELKEIAERALEYLKEKTNDKELIKKLFDDHFEPTECYYDIDEDEVIYIFELEYDDEERDEMDCIKYVYDMNVCSEENEYATDLFNNRSEFIYLFMVFQLNKYEELLEKHLHYWIFDLYENNRPFFYSSLRNYP